MNLYSTRCILCSLAWPASASCSRIHPSTHKSRFTTCRSAARGTRRYARTPTNRDGYEAMYCKSTSHRFKMLSSYVSHFCCSHVELQFQKHRQSTLVISPSTLMQMLSHLANRLCGVSIPCLAPPKAKESLLRS